MGEVEGFLRELEAGNIVCLDTVIFIYAFERHPSFGTAAQAVFRSVAEGRFRACASVLAAGEVFTGVKKAGNDELLMRYRDVFLRFPGLTLVDADIRIMERMADLRADYSLSTPDAIHLATALIEDAPVFLTNDMDLQRVTAVRVLTLPDSLTPGRGR